ncbi:MAG: MASE3 domain-containing protein [Peptococcaceae bacterium]
MQIISFFKSNRKKFISFFMFYLLMALIAFKNYLLFHSILELLCILVGLGIAALALHINQMAQTSNLLSLFGIAYFFIAIFDLLHTLAYQGMGVFNGNTANLGTQLWIIPRYLESATFLISIFFLTKRINIPKTIFIYAIISSLLLATVFTGIFPACYHASSGLTPFKIASEYLISLIFIISAVLIFKKKNALDDHLLSYLWLACVTTCVSELFFTFYISVYGISNMLGHFCKFLSYSFIYQALIKINMEKPYQKLQLLSEKLKQEINEKNKALQIQLKTEHELQRISRLQSIGNLAGGIAHDFNNILTVIMGNTSLAKKYVAADDKKVYDRLVEIEEASLQAKDLARQLLTYSKGGTPIKEIVDIIKLIKESLTFALSGSNTKSEFLTSHHNLYLEVDSGQFKQVLNNLVLNSLQAMPRGGKISVSVDTLEIDSAKGLPLKEGKYVQISLKDEGMGIPEEQIDQIFDPFFTTKDEGHGLGLTTVYSIIEKHNGYITLESQPDQGTVFYLYLPIFNEQISRSAKEAGKNITPKIFKGRILVMDDEELVRRSLGNMLNYLGCQVYFAENGHEAVQLYQNAVDNVFPFDLVILDLTIPGGPNGYETNTRLLKIDPNLVSIVSSGYEDNLIISDYYAYGFKGFLKKPYKIEDLYHILSKLGLQKSAVKII